MRNYHKLQELARNGIKVEIANRYTGNDTWTITAHKNADEIYFSITKADVDLEQGID